MELELEGVCDGEKGLIGFAATHVQNKAQQNIYKKKRIFTTSTAARTGNMYMKYNLTEGQNSVNTSPQTNMSPEATSKSGSNYGRDKVSLTLGRMRVSQTA
jgi:hypothetical protein